MSRKQDESQSSQSKPADPTDFLPAEPFEVVPQATLGRIVHYVLPTGENAGEHRAALVVSPQPTMTPDLQVWAATNLDGLSDHGQRFHNVPYNDPADNGVNAVGFWHWPERT